MLLRVLQVSLLVLVVGFALVVPKWLTRPTVDRVAFNPAGWEAGSKRRSPEHFVLAAVDSERLGMLHSVQSTVLHVGMSSEDLCAALGSTDSIKPRCGYDPGNRAVYRYWIGQYWRDPLTEDLIGPHELWLEIYFSPDGTISEWAEYTEDIL